MQACGYCISDGSETLYVAGDSAYGEHFAQIAADRRIGFAVLPIGAYSPRWFLRSRHLNPPEALRAYRDLGSPTRFMPYHFGSYRLSWEPLGEPLRWFARLAGEQAVDWRLEVAGR